MKLIHEIAVTVPLICLAVRRAIPGGSWRNYVGRAQLLLSCVRSMDLIRTLSFDAQSVLLKRTLNERPHVLGIIRWPYIHSGWSVDKRISVLRGHYEEVKSIAALQIGAAQSLTVVELNDVYANLKLTLDRPAWFMREGELTLNIFVGDFRAYSLSFSYGRRGGQRVIYVGSIQGRKSEGITELYKDLTKKLHGLRPRSLLVNALQAIASATGVSEIRLISDSARIHRHKYFGASAQAPIYADYDQIWSEQDAVAQGDGFYQLGPNISRRNHDDIPANKRASYRRRYDFLERVQVEVSKTLPASSSRMA